MRPKTKASAAQTNMAVSATSSKAKTPVAPPPPARNTPTAPGPVRWSDVVAGRKSTHPDVAPIQRVINITELCENVLDHLPVQDLYRAKRVCRRFTAVINKSTALKPNLFLELRINNVTWVVPDESPCLGGSLLAGPKADEYVSEARAGGRPTNQITIFELHPMLNISEYDRSIAFSTDGLTYFMRHYFRNPGVYEMHCEAKFTHGRIEDLPTASSLNNMYLSQPPVKQLCLDTSGPYYSEAAGGIMYGSVGSVTISDPVGITFAQLSRAAYDLTSRKHSAYVSRIRFKGGVPLMTQEKEIVEKAGEVLADKDPFIPASCARTVCQGCQRH